MYKIKLDKFEGPLDLLLQLIEQQELSITEVSLAQVADQYIEYIHSATVINPEEIADFLLVAAKLLYLKSREILPDMLWEEEEEVDLERQLKIYKEYYEASKKLDKLARQENFSYSRLAPLRHAKEGSSVAMPTGLTGEKMSELFKNALTRLEPIIKIPRSIIEKTITITEKIKEIREALHNAVTFDFRKLVKKGGRSDVIISFLAMLELVKQSDIDVGQDGLFDEIVIKRLES
ncbi:MAG: segregation and condensation protein A [Candidatus Komeilibacteria bacterium]